MIAEHDRVVLACDIPDHHLERGDVGTVIHVYSDSETYEVEFLTLDGETALLATLQASQIRRIRAGEITHARELAIA
jgi:hypothetical protein